MFRKALLLTLFVLGYAVLALADDALYPTAAEEVASRYITQYLLQKHYRKVEVNDSLSLQIFWRYISTLDGGKSYFLASEVERLKKSYGNLIDDEFLAGKSTAGFAVYNFYLQRAKEKMRYMKAAADTMHFNFSLSETVDLDRKADPWPADWHQLTDLWRKELKYRWLELKYSGDKTPNIRQALATSYTRRLNLLSRQSSADAFHAYSRALMVSFDPHTAYYSADEYENLQIIMSRSFEGIGTRLEDVGEYTVVNEVIPGGPAFKGNVLKKGDKIVGVGQKNAVDIIDVVGWKILDVLKLIRGKPGSMVWLKILPAIQGGRGPAVIVPIQRERVDLERLAVKKTVIDRNGMKIAVIAIPSFYLDFDAQQQHTKSYTSTSRDVSRILTELNGEGVEGILLDLRNNGGGSIAEAVAVMGLFIPRGPVVQLVNATGETIVLKAEERRASYSGPLALLVNRYSASSSEIVAAAMQDYGRGVIIGERTFGKGSVQTLIKLPGESTLAANRPEFGQITLTTAKCYRISGASTQHKGVVPDIFMPSMIDHSIIGEDIYTSSLPWSTIVAASYHPLLAVTQTGLDRLRQKEEARSSRDEEYQRYLQDLKSLDRFRKKKSIPLLEPLYKSETEAIKEINRKWSLSSDSTGTPKRDVVLEHSMSVVSDLVDISRQKQ